MRHSTLFSTLILLTPTLAAARETPSLSARERAAPAAHIESAPGESTMLPSAAVASNSARHGFYLHADFGAGYRSFSFQNNDLELTGAGMGISALLGGSIVPNLFFVGELAVSNLINPTISAGDQSRSTENVSARLFGVGPGLVYYVMPANLSFGASFLLTGASLMQEDVKLAETEMGYGGIARIGKEWWVGRSSMGVSGQFSLASMKDKGEEADTLVATGYSLSFAYTY